MRRAFGKRRLGERIAGMARDNGPGNPKRLSPALSRHPGRHHPCGRDLPSSMVHKSSCARSVDMGGVAFLSIRVAEAVRNRLKAVAAERGEKLQDLVGGLIERFLEEAERKPPDLAGVLRCLRSLQPSFQSRGVASLWVFGSVARGDARPDSDVDLALEFAPGADPSLFEIARIKDEAEAVLGRRVDIGERSAMAPRVAAAASRDLVQVF